MHQGEPLYDSLSLLFSDPTIAHDIEANREANEVEPSAPDVSSSVTQHPPIRRPSTVNPVILNFYDEDSDSSI